MKTLKWALFNGGFAALVGWWLIWDITWARNIAVALTILLFVATFLLLLASFDKEIALKIKQTGSGVPRWLDRTYDWIMSMWLIGAGAWVVGGLYLVHFMMLEVVRANLDGVHNGPSVHRSGTATATSDGEAQ